MKRRAGTLERGFSKALIALLVFVVCVGAGLILYGGSIREYVLESKMQRVTSAHYEIMCLPTTLSPRAMAKFANEREPLFAKLDKKLGDTGSNTEIRVIFDPVPPGGGNANSGQEPYSLSGTTIRTTLAAQVPTLPEAADAQALLFAAWGKPGNLRIAKWTAISLAGDWRGSQIGMAAAAVEQKLGHKKLQTVLTDPPAELPSLDDQDLLGAAWISEVADFGGAGAVRKIYSVKISHPSIEEASKALGTPSPELERRWQQWMYAYLAGMPTMQQNSGMPMNMPMPGDH